MKNGIRIIKEKADAKTYLGLAILLYLLWTIVTFLFEGNINTLNSGSGFQRLFYATIVNIFLGTMIAGLLVQFGLKQGLFSKATIGLSGLKRTIVMTSLAISGSLLIFFLQGVPSTHPMVLFNGFAQVFPTTVAEVFICWVLIGSASKAVFADTHPRINTLLLILTSSLVFGLYHFAHSAPFNTWSMVGLLTIIGLFTSFFYFIGRDIFSTIIFHNMMATNGVLASIKQGSFVTPQIFLIALMILSFIVYIVFVTRIYQQSVDSMRKLELSFNKIMKTKKEVKN